jgi:hypothetical protein
MLLDFLDVLNFPSIHITRNFQLLKRINFFQIVYNFN